MLDHSEIRALLPQGHPMMLVDRVVSLEVSVSVVGIKAITGSEPCYRHLDGGLPLEHYAYPTSLLLESFGKTAAILWLTGMGARQVDEDQVLMLAAARGCRILGHAYPGDVLEHTARVSHVLGDNVFVEGETRIGDRLVATIESLGAGERELEDGGLEVDDRGRGRVGVVLGTTVGSLRSMSDYTRETLIEERPYLVSPALFPNTVMNCAAGQSAIRHGLAGINAT